MVDTAKCKYMYTCVCISTCVYVFTSVVTNYPTQSLKHEEVCTQTLFSAHLLKVLLGEEGGGGLQPLLGRWDDLL